MPSGKDDFRSPCFYLCIITVLVFFFSSLSFFSMKVLPLDFWTVPQCGPLSSSVLHVAEVLWLPLGLLLLTRLNGSTWGGKGRDGGRYTSRDAL